MGEHDEKAADVHATALDCRQHGRAMVVAQGSGAEAERIETLARRHGVLVLQDFVLSERLGTIPVGSRIPDPVFDALAVMLEFLRNEDERAKE